MTIKASRDPNKDKHISKTAGDAI